LGLSRESSWRSSVESFTLRDHVLCNWIQWISSQSSWTVRFGVRACRNDDPCCGCWLPQCPKVHSFIPSGHTKIGFNHYRGSVRKSQCPMRRLPFPYGRRVHSSMLVQDPPPGLPFSRGSCWLDQSSTCPSMMSKWLPKRMGRIPEQPGAQTHLCLPLHRSHPKATRPRHILTTWIQRENTHPICPAQSKPTNEDSRKPSLNVRRLRVAAQKHVQKSTVFPNLMDNNGTQTTSVARGGRFICPRKPPLGPFHHTNSRALCTRSRGRKTGIWSDARHGSGETVDSASIADGTKYTCPMYLEMVLDQPGDCSIARFP